MPELPGLTAGRIHALALVLTVVVESLAAALLAALSVADRPRAGRLALFAAAMNVVTHTAFWSVQRHGVLPAEAATTVVEAVGYRAFCALPPARAAAWSVVLNAASWAAGVWLWSRLAA